MIINCRFCSIGAGKASSYEDTVLYENKDYFSIASVGAMVEGWVLVVPKTHRCSMKDDYSSHVFREFTTQVSACLENKYNSRIIAFEHGPNKADSKTGCGTNHAHLHLVPYEKSLLADIMKDESHIWMKCASSEISSVVGDSEYLFYSELQRGADWVDPMGYLALVNTPISQYFRRVISQQLCITDEYDYHVYPRSMITCKTISSLSSC